MIPQRILFIWPTLVTPRSCNREGRQATWISGRGFRPEALQMGCHQQAFSSFSSTIGKWPMDKIGRKSAQLSVMQTPNTWFLCPTKSTVVKDSQQTKNRGLTASRQCWESYQLRPPHGLFFFFSLWTQPEAMPRDLSARPSRPGLGDVSPVQWVQNRPHMHRDGRMNHMTLLPVRQSGSSCL